MYLVKAKAKDIYGLESDWGTLVVTIPRNKATSNILFQGLKYNSQDYNKYYFYEDFLLHERDNILTFLGVSFTNVIKPEAIEKQKVQPVKIDKELDTLDDNKKIEKIYENEDKKFFTEGVKLLEYLFPEAGWGKLQYYPDLYPYFQPLFHFPPGFELIPPGDPLHQIFILISNLGII